MVHSLLCCGAQQMAHFQAMTDCMGVTLPLAETLGWVNILLWNIRAHATHEWVSPLGNITLVPQSHWHAYVCIVQVPKSKGHTYIIYTQSPSFKVQIPMPHTHTHTHTGIISKNYDTIGIPPNLAILLAWGDS